MLAVVLIISLTAMVGEYRTLMKANRRREIALSAILMLVGIILSILRAFHIPIPSPLVVIRILFQPAGQFFNQLLS